MIDKNQKHLKDSGDRYILSFNNEEHTILKEYSGRIFTFENARELFQEKELALIVEWGDSSISWVSFKYSFLKKELNVFWDKFSTEKRILLSREDVNKYVVPGKYETIMEKQNKTLDGWELEGVGEIEKSFGMDLMAIQMDLLKLGFRCNLRECDVFWSSFCELGFQNFEDLTIETNGWVKYSKINMFSEKFAGNYFKQIKK